MEQAGREGRTQCAVLVFVEVRKDLLDVSVAGRVPQGLKRQSQLPDVDDFVVVAVKLLEEHHGALFFRLHEKKRAVGTSLSRQARNARPQVQRTKQEATVSSSSVSLNFARTSVRPTTEVLERFSPVEIAHEHTTGWAQQGSGANLRSWRSWTPWPWKPSRTSTSVL
jgi:hypothetical protein